MYTKVSGFSLAGVFLALPLLLPGCSSTSFKTGTNTSSADKVCEVGFAAHVPATMIGPGTPKEWVGFAGRWYGKWSSGLCNHIIVTQIRKDGKNGKVSIIHAWGKTSFTQPGYEDETGRIVDNKLLFTRKYGHKGTFTYVLQPDGRLTGTVSYLSSDGKHLRVLHIELKRVPRNYGESTLAQKIQACRTSRPSFVPATTAEAGVPKKWRRFAKWWYGVFGNGVCTHLGILSIGKDGSVTVLYGFGNKNVGGAGYKMYRGSGKIQGDTLHFIVNPNEPRVFTYTLRADGQLEGTIALPRNKHALLKVFLKTAIGSPSHKQAGKRPRPALSMD